MTWRDGREGDCPDGTPPTHPPHGNKMVEKFDANLTQQAKYCFPIRYDVTECALLEAKRERILIQFGTNQ